ncbi:MAG: DUF3810 domain-containing protein [Clostridia bacterium]|nr:DUF3810 domain-containing protein [Clostridia bacterium]
MKNAVKRSLWVLIPLSSLVVYNILSFFPAFTEEYYSRGLYPFIASALSYLNQFTGYSLGEFFVYLTVAFFIALLVYFLAVVFSNKVSEKRKKAFGAVRTLLITAAMLYSFFVLFWSLGFNRMPVASSLGYDTEKYTVEELDLLTDKLILKANQLSHQVSRDSSGCFTAKGGKEAVIEKAPYIYSENALPFMKQIPERRIKHNLVPGLLSNINSQGIYSPFTFESNVNIDIPDLYFAATCCHEYAHLQGFCKEDEAEFIAFYVTYDCGDPDFMYSGTVMALNHCLSQLRKTSPEYYLNALNKIDDLIYNDFRQHSDYWDRYDTEISKASDRINDNYLKSNKQSSGIKSYGLMIDILLSMQRNGDI